MDTDRRRLLRPCIESQGQRSSADVRTGARGARLAKLKKNDLASEAERLAVGMGWLLVMLRAVEPEAQEEVTPVVGSGE